jgi:hypothetical protein
MKKIYYFVLFLGLIAACKKDDNKQYDPYPIKGKVTGSALGFVIDWNGIQSADFVSYRIWQSTTLDSINEKNLQSTAFQLATITDSEKNSFKSNNNFSVNKNVDTYYKIEVVLKSRSVWSRNFKLDYQPTAIYNKQVDRILTDEVSKKLYLFTNTDGLLRIFDSETEKMTDVQTTQTGLPFSSFSYCFGDFNGKRELYIVANQYLYIFEANTLLLTKKIAFTSNLNSVATNSKGVLYIQTLDSSNNLQVYDRATLTLIKKYPQTEYSELLYLPKQNKLLAVKADFPQPAHYANLSDDGKTINGNTADVSLYTQNGNLGDLSIIDVSKDEETFVMGSLPAFFDKNFKLKGVPDKSFNGQFIDYRFDPMTNITYAIRTNDKNLTTINNKGAITTFTNFSSFPIRIAIVGNKKWVFSYPLNIVFTGETQIEKFEF